MKKRRDYLLKQYWLYDEMASYSIPNSAIDYWQEELNKETTWECKNIISCIIDTIKQKLSQ